MPNFELKDKRCANCGACVIACADRKNLGTHCDIRKLLQFERGEFPNVEARTLSTSCYHCDNPKCVEVCPTGAMHVEKKFHTVQVDRNQCINCHTCVKGCPYGQITLDDDDKIMKCDFCIDELKEGKQPVCIEACVLRCLHIVDDKEISANHRRINQYLEGSQQVDIGAHFYVVEGK